MKFCVQNRHRFSSGGVGVLAVLSRYATESCSGALWHDSRSSLPILESETDSELFTRVASVLATHSVLGEVFARQFGGVRSQL